MEPVSIDEYKPQLAAALARLEKIASGEVDGDLKTVAADAATIGIAAGAAFNMALQIAEANIPKR